tara:strand:- start:40 stop:1314 length:1275 start_codon:yes stop_codon:yes gene_type:complete
MATETAAFERASIVAFYDAIQKGAQLKPQQDADLFSDLLTEFANMNTLWYEGILRQAEALIDFLSHKEGSTDNTWLYAHFEGKTETIPSTSTTELLDYIWNSLPAAQKKIFAGKKDSWNTADVYMVKKKEEKKIKGAIDVLVKEFGGDDMQPAVLVGTINAYMAKLLDEKKFLGISLKQPTKNAAVNVTPTNVKLGPDGLEVKSGEVVTPLDTKMDVLTRNNKQDFAGNSLRFNAKFEAGAYAKQYVWESKVSSGSNEATEPRDMALSNKGKYIVAAARNGAIPAPKMAALVENYTGEKLNYNIPTSRKFNAAETKYWKDYLKSISTSKNKKVPISLGKYTIDGTAYSPEDFIARLFNLDDGNASGKTFATKIRSKMRHLRYIKMYLDAESKGKLGELIAHAYFLSSKMNIKQGDLAGPFIKVQ